MTQRDLARKICYTDRWLSNFETGRQYPRADQVTAMEQALDLPTGALLNTFQQLEAESLPTWFRPWADEEREAEVLRTFQIALIPGLLQTEDYARALLPDNESLVQARMERQRILTREWPKPPKLHCVLDEAVLYQLRGDKDVMRKQLEHLITSIAPPQLTIQIIRSEKNPRSLGAFTIGSVAGRDIGYVETAIRGIVTSSREDVAELTAAWEAIRTFALPQQESIEFIRQVIEDKWT